MQFQNYLYRAFAADKVRGERFGLAGLSNVGCLEAINNFIPMAFSAHQVGAAVTGPAIFYAE